MLKRCRLNFIVDEANKLVIVRPIGDIPTAQLVSQLFEHYHTLDKPWSWRRINDLRRFDGFFDQDTLDDIARRWAGLTAGVTYKTQVAVVTNDPLDTLRLPAASAQFPNETICLFTDFHEAVGWLLAKDPDTYLAGLAEVKQRVDDSLIVIE